MARINIRRIVGSLMVGVVVTVLVAWRCHRAEEFPHRSYFSDNKAWPTTLPEDWPKSYELSICYMSAFKIVTHYHHNFHQLAPTSPSDHRFDHHLLEEARSGWPLMALRRFSASKTLVGRQGLVPIGLIHEGIPMPTMWRGVLTDRDDRLPLVPLWPGFLVNSLFYGSIPWLIMFGVSTLKRRRRIRRGLCAQCAYPNAGLNLCPECGTPTPSTTTDGTPASESSVKPLEPSPSPRD